MRSTTALHSPPRTWKFTDHRAIRTFVTGAFSLFKTFGLTENNIFLNGNKAAIKWTGTATGNNGKSITFEGVDPTELDSSGKIILLNAFWPPPSSPPSNPNHAESGRSQTKLDAAG